MADDEFMNDTFGYMYRALLDSIGVYNRVAIDELSNKLRDRVVRFISMYGFHNAFGIDVADITEVLLSSNTIHFYFNGNREFRLTDEHGDGRITFRSVDFRSMY